MAPCEPIPKGTGAGPHTLKWQYVKDGSSSDGDDCGWVASSSNNHQSSIILNQFQCAYACPIRLSLRAGSELAERDGDHCIAEYDDNGVLQRTYIYGPGVDQPICMIEEAGTYAGTYFYHFDALGSVVALSNAAGNTVQAYDYSVWGQVGAEDVDHPNPYMFTARRFDKETGLYYYRARYYNPEIGRFLQTDPVGYDAGMNLYRYCSNNPWNKVDPFGHTDACDVNNACNFDGDEWLSPGEDWPVGNDGRAKPPYSRTGEWQWTWQDCNEAAAAQIKETLDDIRHLKWRWPVDVIIAFGCLASCTVSTSGVLLIGCVTACAALVVAADFVIGFVLREYTRWAAKFDRINRQLRYCHCRAVDGGNETHEYCQEHWAEW